jgi:hypothetical protein
MIMYIPCSWHGEPPSGLRGSWYDSSRLWPCGWTPSTLACFWKHYPSISGKGSGS